MFTLTFLICMANGQCIQNAPDHVFPTKIHCELAAEQVLSVMEDRMLSGEVPAHLAAYQCVSWGTPS